MGSDIIDAKVDAHSTNTSESVLNNPTKPVTVSRRTTNQGQDLALLGQTKVGDDQVTSSTTNKSEIQPKKQKQMQNSTVDQWKTISVILTSIGALLAILLSRINVDQGIVC